MGNSINARNTVLNMTDIAKIQNIENHREDIHKQQVAMAIQKESAIKEEQVQTTNKAEHTEINTKNDKSKDKQKKGKKNINYVKPNKIGNEDNIHNPDEQHFIDLKAD
jgi:hypothetical protein